LADHLVDFMEQWEQFLPMTEQLEAGIETAELARLLTAVDAGVLLTPSRILRRVIKQDRRLMGIGLQVPHRKVYVIGREALLAIAGRDELELEPERGLPRTVILIAKPEPDRLARLPRGQALIKYWRLLFHARVHVALEQRPGSQQLTPSRVRERIQQIGQAEFDEIRSVLRQENFLLPPRDDRAIYAEFAAVYLELRYFASSLSSRYFPTLRDRQDVDRMLADEVLADRLFESTRPQGAPAPVMPEETAVKRLEATPRSPARVFLSAEDSHTYCQKLWSKAQRVGARGNAVRAALLLQRACIVADVETMAAQEAEAQLDRLAARLQAALRLTDAEAESWRHALPALLKPAAIGIWPVEARLLYDLQKCCVDHERDVYDLDLVEWVLSLGRRPIKRLLPNHRAVLMAKHCRRAAGRLPAARLEDQERRQLATLFQAAVERTEEALRECLRPAIGAALERVGLAPRNLPERVARDKLIEELLDLTVERGFLSMSDLRDAVSRNNLKLADLVSPREFLLGDQLLRANRRLAKSLDGVYRRGEIYLRWLQRLSSLSFGTRVGRFVTRYLVLPYGVAFVTLEGLLHMINPVAQWTGHEEIEFQSGELGIAVAIFGTFLFALFHVAAVQKQVVRALSMVFGILRGVFFDLPAALLRLPFVRRILESKPFALVRDFLLKPLALTACLSVFFPLYGIKKEPALVTASIFFLVASLFLSSRWGRTVEESITDALVRTWLRFRIEIFPALFAFTMELFKELVEAIERFLYTVDEWLRFRSGQSRLVLITKTILGFVWFFVTYIVRIYVNLFIEPTVNPIKHFPVVTVAAKLMLPLIPILWPILAAPFMPLGHMAAHAIASINLALLPGIFGFLVWELKENWRLYEANRPWTLRTVVIGHHGETLARYLKPGFHSGTIPKLYAKLRRAERRAHRSGNWKSSRKYREALHHIEVRLRHFIEREFLALLNASRLMEGRAVTTGRIGIGSTRISIELCGASSEPSPWVAFEERSGWLVASIASPGWFASLSQGQRSALRSALAGLYKISGVDLIREHIETYLEPGTVAFDILEEGLVVWPSTGYEVQALYRLRDGQILQPQPLAGPLPPTLPSLEVTRLIFSQVAIPWPCWVAAWQADQAGKMPSTPLLEGVSLLGCYPTLTLPPNPLPNPNRTPNLSPG
jgi:hypothetical protein